jgi:hypothetical protein
VHAADYIPLSHFEIAFIVDPEVFDRHVHVPFLGFVYQIFVFGLIFDIEQCWQVRL